MPGGIAMEWVIAWWFPENLASQHDFWNLKPKSSKQINNNFYQWLKNFIVVTVGELSTNLTPNIYM